MKRSVLVLLFVMISISLVTCSSQKSTTSDMHSAGDDMNMAATKLTTLLEDYWEEFIELNPIFATLVGDDRYDDKFGC